MKRITLLLTIIFVLIFASNVYAYKSFGNVNEYIAYNNIGITSGFYPKVCFELENDTKKRVRIFTDVIFSDRSGYIDKATVHIKLQPKSKKKYCAYLDERDFKGAKDALFLKWEVYMLEIDEDQIYFRESKY